MPTNLPADYFNAEERFRSATTPEDKVKYLEEMLSTIPKHKGTDHLRADLRKKLSKLKTAATSKKGSKKQISPYHINKEGAGLVVVIGSPQNVDRLVTVYRAALRADRDFAVDAYGADVARATGNPNIPRPGEEWLEDEGRIVALLNEEGERVEEASGRVSVVLDRTPFYAEAGGQVADRGFLLDGGSGEELARVEQVVPVWQRLVDRNAAILVDPGNPDLLHRGQVIDLGPDGVRSGSRTEVAGD